MNYLMIVKVIHILTAIFWGGAVFMLAWFIIPAVKKAGPDGNKIMMAITGANKFPMWMSISAMLNIISGFLLMYELSSHFDSVWFGSSFGIALSTGTLFALVAFFMGLLINKPTGERIEVIAAEISLEQGPTEDQIFELNKLKQKISKSTNIIAGMIFLATIFMAAARYA